VKELEFFRSLLDSIAVCARCMRSRNSAEGSSSNWMKRRRELTEVGQQQSRRDQSGARCDRRASVESPSVTRTAGAIDSGSRRARSARRRCSRKMTSVFAGTHIQPRGSTPWVPPTHTTHELPNQGANPAGVNAPHTAKVTCCQKKSKRCAARVTASDEPLRAPTAEHARRPLRAIRAPGEPPCLPAQSPNHAQSMAKPFAGQDVLIEEQLPQRGGGGGRPCARGMHPACFPLPDPQHLTSLSLPPSLSLPLSL
jgi:hypothetical protein